MAITRKPSPRETSLNWLSTSCMDRSRLVTSIEPPPPTSSTCAIDHKAVAQGCQNALKHRASCPSSGTPVVKTAARPKIRSRGTPSIRGCCTAEETRAREPANIPFPKPYAVVLAPLESSTQTRTSLTEKKSLMALNSLAIRPHEASRSRHGAQGNSGVFLCVHKG